MPFLGYGKLISFSEQRCAMIPDHVYAVYTGGEPELVDVMRLIFAHG
jgi:hypothetical protein